MRTGTRRRAAGSRKRARTILIIEDQTDQREMYASYFAVKGFLVLTARDGPNGLALARTHRPDVIVTDLSIPHIDGWETTRRLKDDPRTAGIPVIACSAHVFGRAAERALVAGCISYMAKPCLPEELLSEVLRVLKRAA